MSYQYRPIVLMADGDELVSREVGDYATAQRRGVWLATSGATVLRIERRTVGEWEAVSPVDDPATDLIGTIRQDAGSLPVVKSNTDTWDVIGNGARLNDGDWCVRKAAVVGAVPGTPAAEAAKPTAPKTVNAGDPEPPRDARYIDRDGDTWSFQHGRWGYAFDGGRYPKRDWSEASAFPWTLVSE